MSKTSVINWRLTDAERTGLDKLAKGCGVKRSRLLRRIVREAIRHRPDYFFEGVKEIRSAHRELAAIGRNLNQIAARLNEENIANRFKEDSNVGAVGYEKLSDELVKTQQSLKNIKGVFASEIEAATSRGIKSTEFEQ